MRISHSATAVALVLLFLSCNQSANEAAKDDNTSQTNQLDQKDQNLQTLDTTVTPIAAAKKSGNFSPGNEDWDKKIIRTGTLNLEVKDYNKYYQSLSEIVRREGGYISQEDQQQTEYQISNNLFIKVPVDRFQETMDLISKGTGNEEVRDKKVSSEDVTTQMIDTKSRIETKKEVRLRYLELLRQAKNMKDILQVQSEINNIQEEMETAAGRLNYLGHASAYSTINLTCYQILNPTARDIKEPGFSIKIFNAFNSGWDFIKAIILGVISIWPLWFFLAGLWIVVRKWKPVKAN